MRILLWFPIKISRETLEDILGISLTELLLKIPAEFLESHEQLSEIPRRTLGANREKKTLEGILVGSSGKF